MRVKRTFGGQARRGSATTAVRGRSRRPDVARSRRAFTLVELMIAVAILGTLSAIAIVAYTGYAQSSKVKRAIADLQSIQLTITVYEGANQKLPASLNDVEMGDLRDPWGNPYRYQRLDLVPRGSWRKDKNLVPLNSTYDLWSTGADGASQPALTARVSHDDIVRANDGGFVGLATDY